MTADKLLLLAKPHQDSLKLLDDVARDKCESEVKRYHKACDRYAQCYRSQLEDCYPPSAEAQDSLSQARLEIHWEDVARIEAHINQQQETSLEQYRVQMEKRIHSCYPINEAVKQNNLMPALKELQQQLKLGDKTVMLINTEAINEYEQALAIYKQVLESCLITQRQSLQDTTVIAALREQQESLKVLNDTVITQIHSEVEQDAKRRRERKQNERRGRFF